MPIGGKPLRKDLNHLADILIVVEDRNRESEVIAEPPNGES
jgi:hypothetical protein